MGYPKGMPISILKIMSKPLKVSNTMNNPLKGKACFWHCRNLQSIRTMPLPFFLTIYRLSVRNPIYPRHSRILLRVSRIFASSNKTAEAKGTPMWKSTLGKIYRKWCRNIVIISPFKGEKSILMKANNFRKNKFDVTWSFLLKTCISKSLSMN